MNTVEVLETDVGTFPVPPHMKVAYEACKIRRDRQPDRRTRAAKVWYALFRDFQQEKLNEYMSGAR